MWGVSGSLGITGAQGGYVEVQERYALLIMIIVILFYWYAMYHCVLYFKISFSYVPSF
jgi:hypothetical protein